MALFSLGWLLAVLAPAHWLRRLGLGASATGGRHESLRTTDNDDDDDDDSSDAEDADGKPHAAGRDRALLCLQHGAAAERSSMGSNRKRGATQGTLVKMGERVALAGLSARPELNGRTGVVMAVSTTTARCIVRVEGLGQDGCGDAEIAVRPENLTPTTMTRGGHG